MRVSVQRHAPAAVYTQEQGPRSHYTGGSVVPSANLDKEARERVLSPLTGIELRSPGRPARSQTLY
jgi:hypothetical protein